LPAYGAYILSAGLPSGVPPAENRLRIAADEVLDRPGDSRYGARANLVSSSDGTAASSSFLSLESGWLFGRMPGFFYKTQE